MKSSGRKMSVKRKPTLKSLKAKLDKVFSIFIRQRGMDEGGTNNCVTCGVLKHWKELQCGHWISRVHLSTRWHPLNAHPQCGTCNVLKRGNYPEYARYMFKEYGQDTMEELLMLKRQTLTMRRPEYEELIERFGKLVKGMG